MDPKYEPQRGSDGVVEIPLNEINLGKQIGKGVSATVFAAEWRGRQVAVKVTVWECATAFSVCF
jgi:hypothetical protein